MSRAFAVDIDGCIANFTLGFSTLCNSWEETAPIVTNEDAKAWRWQTWYWDAGPAAAEIIEQAWAYIKKSPSFWTTLEPLFPEAMPLLAEMSDTQPLIFITRRDGVDVWHQTTKWLRKHGVREPLVYCVKPGEEKSEVMDKLGLQLIIEDSPKYVAEDLTPAGKSVILIDWQYNRMITGPKYERLIRVKTLTEALETGRSMYGVQV